MPTMKYYRMPQRVRGGKALFWTKELGGRKEEQRRIQRQYSI